jgi:hypothetical protein
MKPATYSLVPPEGISGWHPHADRLWRYLRRGIPDGRLPDRSGFDPVDMPDLLPRLWLLDVRHEPFDLVYRLCGTKEADSLEFEPTGRSFLDVHRERIAAVPDILTRYRDMARDGIATWRRGPLAFRHRDRHKSVENLMVPMTDGGERVAILMCLSLVFRIDGTIF